MCPICVSIEPCERHFPYLLYTANVDCESFQEPKATQPTWYAGTARSTHMPPPAVNLHPEPPPEVKTKEKHKKTMAKEKEKEKETESKKKRQREGPDKI